MGSLEPEDAPYRIIIKHGAHMWCEKVAGLLLHDTLAECCKSHIPEDKLEGRTVEEVKVCM